MREKIAGVTSVLQSRAVGGSVATDAVRAVLQCSKTCGFGRAHRELYCVDHGGHRHAAHNCHVLETPETHRHCYVGPCQSLTSHCHIGSSLISSRSLGSRTGIATRWSRVRFPAAAASTGMGDRLRTDKPPRYFTKPPRPTQPPTLSGTGNEYQPKCGDALRLGSKCRMAHSTCE